MSDVDELIECALRVKQLREDLRAAEQKLAAVAARHRGGPLRSSTKPSSSDGTRDKTPTRKARRNALATKAGPQAQPSEMPTSVSGRVREHLRANAAKTYDSATLLAELKLPKKELLNIRALLKKFTKQQLLVRVDRGQYRWRA